MLQDHCLEKFSRKPFEPWPERLSLRDEQVMESSSYLAGSMHLNQKHSALAQKTLTIKLNYQYKTIYL